MLFLLSWTLCWAASSHSFLWRGQFATWHSLKQRDSATTAYHQRMTHFPLTTALAQTQFLRFLFLSLVVLFFQAFAWYSFVETFDDISMMTIWGGAGELFPRNFVKRSLCAIRVALFLGWMCVRRHRWSGARYHLDISNLMGTNAKPSQLPIIDIDDSCSWVVFCWFVITPDLWFC